MVRSKRAGGSRARFVCVVTDEMNSCSHEGAELEVDDASLPDLVKEKKSTELSTAHAHIEA